MMMIQALNKTGRPILYTCEWAFYQHGAGKDPNYDGIAKHCNLNRNHPDVRDDWVSVVKIIDFYAKNQDRFRKYNGN